MYEGLISLLCDNCGKSFRVFCCQYKGTLQRYCCHKCRAEAKRVRQTHRSLARETAVRAVTITADVVFTDSPSHNVSLFADNGRCVFYNSERVNGCRRLQSLALILRINTIKSGDKFNVSLKQLDAITAL